MLVDYLFGVSKSYFFLHCLLMLPLMLLGISFLTELLMYFFPLFFFLHNSYLLVKFACLEYCRFIQWFWLVGFGENFWCWSSLWDL
jgi:hypothetical protein